MSWISWMTTREVELQSVWSSKDLVEITAKLPNFIQRSRKIPHKPKALERISKLVAAKNLRRQAQVARADIEGPHSETEAATIRSPANA